MDTKLYEIYQIIEDIKTNITDNQYKKIMDNILILSKNENRNFINNQFIRDKNKLYDNLIDYINRSYNMTYLVSHDKLTISDIVETYNAYNVHKVIYSDVKDIILNHFNLKIIKNNIIGLRHPNI